jgi:polysaccharide export outer membrane protein
MAREISIAVLLLLASATGGWAQQADYAVGAADVLTITVWGETDMSGAYKLQSDGTFAFPLIGRVQASGRTPRELEDEIRTRLANGFLKRPDVRVMVTEYASQHIFVVGEVKQPGIFPMTGQTTLVGALARAGSITADAGGEVLVLRPSPESRAEGPLLPDQAAGSEVIRIDIKRLQAGTGDADVQLRHRDTVFVPRAESIYVLGYVNHPGAYPIRGQTTVLQALALAGGVNERGSTSGIRIVREVDGKRTELKVKPSDIIVPGDTVVVRQRMF